MCAQVSCDYGWQRGQTAVAWFSPKTYAKVKVVKDNRDVLHGEEYYLPVQNRIHESDSDDDCEYGYSEVGQCNDYKKTDSLVKMELSPSSWEGLCYYIKTAEKEHFWVPRSAMRPILRCRMQEIMAEPNKVFFHTKRPGTAHLRVILFTMDPLLPFNVKPDCCKRLVSKNPERPRPSKSKHQQDFREYILTGKDSLFRSYEQVLTSDHQIMNSRATLDYLLQSDATEEKFDLQVSDVMCEREIEDYLQQCWQYSNARHDGEEESAREMSLTCVECGARDKSLRVCPRCPATYHIECRQQWLINIVHGKAHPKKTPYKEALLRSRVRGGHAPPRPAPAAPARVLPCPSCMWGPDPSERVWHMKVYPMTHSYLLLDEDEAPPMKKSKWL